MIWLDDAFLFFMVDLIRHYHSCFTITIHIDTVKTLMSKFLKNKKTQGLRVALVLRKYKFNIEEIIVELLMNPPSGMDLMIVESPSFKKCHFQIIIGYSYEH